MAKLSGGLRSLFLLEFLDSVASFLLDFVFVLYLSNEFRIGDVVTGWLYAMFGCLVIVYGLLFGCFIDYFGVQRVLVVGSAASLLSRLCFINASDKTEAILCLIFLYPASTALTSPVIKLAIRRYTTKQDREYAFHIIYIVINVASLVAGLCLSLSRKWFLTHCRLTPSGTVCTSGALFGMLKLTNSGFQSFLHVALLMGVGAGVLQLIVAVSLLKLPPVSEPVDTPSLSFDASYRTALSLPNVWSCFYIGIAIALGAGSLMRHFGATFPKYYTREFGHSAAYETILMLNPLLILIFLPAFMFVKNRYPFQIGLFGYLVIGSALSAASMFALVVETSRRACVAAMFLFTLGEVLWSPKLLELCVAVGEEGREGATLAVSAFPKFLSRASAGMVSGHLLGLFCAAHGPRRSHIMWLILGVWAALTPVILLVFKSPIFTPELLARMDEDTSKLALEAHISRSKGTHISSYDEETSSTASSGQPWMH